MRTDPVADRDGEIRPSVADATVVFVLGITPRSGTNYLSNLLYLHPQCDRVAGIWEDFVVSGSSLLSAYVERVSSHWKAASWGLSAETAASLRSGIGRAVTRFLLDHRQGLAESTDRVREHPRCVVTKTPSVADLAHAHLFPNTRTIVIVRDGRCVVSSGMRGFGWTFDHAVSRWAHAADEIIRSRDAGQEFLLVRYEDLLTNLQPEMLRIFSYLGLDPAGYDFTKADALPMTGSSFVAEAAGSIHWAKVPRHETSQLLNRYGAWTGAMHRKFNRAAGEQSKYFAYAADPLAASGLDMDRHLMLPLRLWRRLKGTRPRRPSPG